MEKDFQSDLFDATSVRGDEAFNAPPDHFDHASDPGYLSSLDQELGQQSSPAPAGQDADNSTLVIGAAPLEPGGEHNLSRHLRDETVHKLFHNLNGLGPDQTVEDLIAEIGVEEFLSSHLRDFDAEGFPDLGPSSDTSEQRSALLARMTQSMRDLQITDADTVGAAFNLSEEEMATLKADLAVESGAELTSFFDDTDSIPDDTAPSRTTNIPHEFTSDDLRADKHGNFHLAEDPSIATDEFGVPVGTSEYKELTSRFKAGRAALRAYDEFQQGRQIDMAGLDSIEHAREALQSLLDGNGTDAFGYPAGYSIPCSGPQYLERAKQIAARRLELNPQSFEFELLETDDRSPEALLARQYAIERQSADIFHLTQSIAPPQPDANRPDAAPDAPDAQAPARHLSVYDYDGQLYSFINQHSAPTGQAALMAPMEPLFNQLCLLTAGHAPADEQGKLLFACAINAAWATLAASTPGHDADYSDKTRPGLKNIGRALAAAGADGSPYAAFKQGLAQLTLNAEHKQVTARVDEVFKDLLAKAIAANKVRQEQAPAPARSGSPSISTLLANSLLRIPSLRAARASAQSAPIDLNQRRAAIIANTVDEMSDLSSHVMSNMLTPSWAEQDSVNQATRLDKLAKSITPLIDGFRQSGGRPGDIKDKDGKPVDFSKLSEAVGSALDAMSTASRDKETKDLLEGIKESVKQMNESIKRMLEAIKSVLGAGSARNVAAMPR